MGCLHLVNTRPYKYAAVLIMGCLHLATTRGKIKSGPGGKGNVILPRISFAPLAFAVVQSESKRACREMVEWYRMYSMQENLLKIVEQCALVITDFASALPDATQELVGTPNPILRKCWVRARNLTQPGFRGYTLM